MCVYIVTVYVPIEARYPIEAHPPFREQKLHTNVYICNKDGKAFQPKRHIKDFF